MILRHSYVCLTLQGKPKLLILGSGWGGFRLLKNVDKSLYDVSVVSPRNRLYIDFFFFLFSHRLPFHSIAGVDDGGHT